MPGAEANNEPLPVLDINKICCELVNTLSLLSTENLIQIGSMVSEIWSGKVKSQVMRLFRQAYLFGKIWY